MSITRLNLHALLGARICHDLISPVGAIGNGMELLSMAGDVSGPEADLIGESVNNANARLRFFRLAFGVGASDQMISVSDLTRIIDDFYSDESFSVTLNGVENLTKPDAKLLSLLLLCCESGMARRGSITISAALTLTCEAQKLPDEHPLWGALTEQSEWPPEVSAAQVHYPLAKEALAEMDLRLCFGRKGSKLAIWTEPQASNLTFSHEPSRHRLQGT